MHPARPHLSHRSGTWEDRGPIPRAIHGAAFRQSVKPVPDSGLRSGGKSPATVPAILLRAARFPRGSVPSRHQAHKTLHLRASHNSAW